MKEIAKGNMDSVHLWGKTSMNEIIKVYKHLVKPNDPVSALKTFDILRAGFYDFDAFVVEVISDSSAKMTITLGERALAKEAIANQMSGMVERLLELCGAKNIRVVFEKKAWKNNSETIVGFFWE